MIRNSNSAKVESVQEATDVAVQRLAMHGESIVRISLRDSDVMSTVRDEVRTSAALFKAVGLFREHGAEEGWIGVERATFFSPRHLKHATLGQKIGALLFPSRLFVPKTHKVKGMFAEAMRESAIDKSLTGISSGVASLRDWQPNRIGINRMEGKQDRPAFIPEHVDTKEELGAVVVLDVFRQGMSGSSYLVEDNVTIIFGRDTCREVGVEQAPHPPTPSQFRLSVTFAELKPSLPVNL